MLFADILPPAAIDEMIDQRLAEIRENLERIEARAKLDVTNSGEAFVDGFAAAVQRAMADYIEEHRHRLVASSLMPAERAVAE